MKQKIVFYQLILFLMIIILPVKIQGGLPTPEIEIFLNAPNPFDSRREATYLIYYLAREDRVELQIYDLLGYPVRHFSFSSGNIGGKAGWNIIPWDGTNQDGRKVACGGYLGNLKVFNGSQVTVGNCKIGVVR